MTKVQLREVDVLSTRCPKRRSGFHNCAYKDRKTSKPKMYCKACGQMEPANLDHFALAKVFYATD